MTDATFVDEGNAPGILKYPTSFDGTRGPNDAEGYYTPICSRGSYIYLAENTWAPNTLTGNIAQISKSDHSQVARFSTGSQSWTPGSGVAVAGHASASVGVDGTSGRVVTRRGGHAQALDARYEVTPGTLSSITTLTDPAGGDVRADYRRFWRAPDGTLWLYYRGNDGKGELYKWNDATATLDRVGGSGPFSDYGASTGSYAANLTFDPVTGDVYAVTEALLTTTSGFPAHFIGCVKSTDNGTSWTELDGTPVTLPLNLTNQTVVAGGTLADEVVAAQITLDANGNPFIIMGWMNAAEGDQFLATWTARWNGTGWDYVRLYEQIGDGTDQLGQWQNSKIIPQITTHDGIMIIVMKEVGQSVTQRLVALIQYPDDATTTWHRWVLHPDDLYTGAYIDQWSLPDDSLLRIYPVTSGDLVGYDQTSEIWELPVQDVGIWGDNTQTNDILTNSHTDTPVEAGVYYRYRVASYDSATTLQSDWSDWVVVAPLIEQNLGTAEETDTATTVTGSKVFTLGTAVDTSSGQPLTAAKSGTVLPATETDAAIPLVQGSSQSLGVATETSSAMTVTGSKSTSIDPATTTAQAQDLASTKSTTLTAATEVSSAMSLSVSEQEAVGTATETSSARLVTGAKTHTLGPATETSTARPLADATVPATSGGWSAYLGEPRWSARIVT